MGLIDSIAGTITKALSPAADTKGLSADQVRAAILSYMGGGLVVPEDNVKSYITNGYNANLVVHTAVEYITSKAAEIPIRVRVDHGNRDYEYLTSHKALSLLDKPNSLSTWGEFCAQALGFYLLTGNWFGYKVQSSTRDDGTPLEVITLPSQYMEIKIAGSAAWADISHYQLNDITMQRFDKENIVHWRTPSYDYDNGKWLYGISPLKAGLSSLNTSNSNERAQATMSQNLGALGLLMFDHANKASPPTPTGLRNIQNSIREKVEGESNRGRVVATSMMYKWQQLGLSSNDLQLIEQNKVSARQLYSLFKLPSLLFNDNEQASYNNVEQFKKSAYEDAILPALKGFLGKLSNSVGLAENEKLVPDTSGIDALKKDHTDMIRALSTASFIPTSQKQSMIGLTPDYILDEYPDQDTSIEPMSEGDKQKRKALIERLKKERNG